MEHVYGLIDRDPGGMPVRPLALPRPGLGRLAPSSIHRLTGMGPLAGVSGIDVPAAAAWSATQWLPRNASGAWRRLCTR